ALTHQALEPRHRRPRRKQGAWPVLLIQVDVVDTEPAQAATRPPAGHEGKADRKQLAREENRVAAAANRLADDSLRPTEAIDLGSVDQVDAEVESAAYDLARGFGGVFAAVAPLGRTELPRAEADHRDSRPASLDEPQEPAASLSYTICDHDSIAR